jgi:lysozyme
MPRIRFAKKLIKQFEALRLSPYYCRAALKTIGYGHVIKTHESTKLGCLITIEQAEALVDEDASCAHAALHKYCYAYLTLNQEVALISLIFNCGTQAFKNSSLRHKLNQGEYTDAAHELLKWVYVGKIKLPGLLKCPKLERAVFFGQLGKVDL